MTPEPEQPRLRTALDAAPIEHEGQHFYTVTDALGLAHEPIVVSPQILFLMSQMDGTANLVELQIRFTQKFGELIDTAKLEGIISDLDERGFLDSPSFRRRMDEIVAAYRKTPVRTASHAGQAYPADREELGVFLDGIVPGFGSAPRGSSPSSPGRLRGLVAPHIDIERGRSQYALAYARLAGREPPHTVVLFGTGHFAKGSTYILTKKDFATPLGTAPVDGDFCDRLAAACPFDIFEGELAHRSEHSIEFQVLFLQHIFGADRTPRIVPILCTSFEPDGVGTALDPKKPEPAALPAVGSFLDALEAAATDCPGEVLLIAGADMCHVGPKFGAPRPLEEPELERIRSEDRAALDAGVTRGADAFYGKVSAIGNRNNICGVVSIYTVLEALKGLKGEVLGYDMALEPEGFAAVGFGAAAIGEAVE
jgi:MEMO1 family protein